MNEKSFTLPESPNSMAPTAKQQPDSGVKQVHLQTKGDMESSFHKSGRHR